MASGEVLLTNVKHGQGESGDLWVDEGTLVDQSGLPSDAIDKLREAGAVGFPTNVAKATDTIQAQADRIKQLEAALAEAEANQQAQVDSTPAK